MAKEDRRARIAGGSGLPPTMGVKRAPRLIAVLLALLFLFCLAGLIRLEPLLKTVMGSGLIFGSHLPASYVHILRGVIVSGLVMSGGALLLWRIIPLPGCARRLDGRTGLLVIAAAFLVSVAVRWPALGRSLSDNHEWETAMSLVMLENQSAYPLTQTGLALPMSYPGEANQVTSDQWLLIEVAQGVGYYVSFPPFAIMLAAGVIRLFGLPIVPVTLQGINLVFHLVASLLLFLVLLRLLRGSPWRTFAALVAVMLFIFNPAGLWFFSNTYGIDFFWHFLWIISLFVFIRLLDAAAIRQVPAALWIGFFVTVFCLVYADIHGAICAAIYFVYLVARYRESRDYPAAALVVAGGVALAVGLTVFQYSRISGFDTLMDHVGNAFSRRCLVAPANHLRILMHYILMHAFLLIPLGCMSLLLLASANRRDRGGRGDGLWRWILLLSAASVVVHHVVFLQWTAIHNFSVLKAIVPFTILVAVVSDRVMNSVALGPSSKKLVLALLLASVVASTVEYRTVFSYSHDPDRFRRIGEEIALLAAPEEVVFLVSEAYELGQVSYYSKRNTRRLASREAAYQWMRETGRPRGIVFSIDHKCDIVDVSRLSIQQPSGTP
jgi:hypothetical protein